ncbi:MAG: TRAP transporter large permease subunit [Streptosporangiales bacterium]|nr:TRAP transporter large permease subunit [Streptosporangiales bacterium]
MDVSSIALFVLLFLLLLSSVPISIALGLTTLLYIFYYTTLPMTQISDTLFNGINSFPLMAIPFFVLAANLMVHGGISRRLVAAANAVVGSFPGGLGVTAVASCVFFAAISGSSAATVVAVGTLLIPSMIRAGYPREFSTGLIATTGGLGILIPPSVPLIVYGVVTETSIGDLFLAGIVPGLLTGILLIALVVFLAMRRNLGAETLQMSRSERLRALRDAFLGILLPIFVLGGIYGGVFTPTEAAAMAVCYAFLVSMFVYREINFSDLTAIIVRSARMSAMVMFIIANAILFTFVLSLERIPGKIAQFLTDLDLSAWVFLLMVNVLFLIVGVFMDSIGAILILAPILYPIAMKLGVNPVHFGIIIVMNFEIGAITPPLGINLFVASGISRMSALRVARAAIPWACVLLIALGLVTYFPDIALTLVGK